MVHVYVLNPKTTVIQTLRNALFLSKIVFNDFILSYSYL